jgi:hypothetical protein
MRNGIRPAANMPWHCKDIWACGVSDHGRETHQLAAACAVDRRHHRNGGDRQTMGRADAAESLQRGRRGRPSFCASWRRPGAEMRCRERCARSGGSNDRTDLVHTAMAVRSGAPSAQQRRTQPIFRRPPMRDRRLPAERRHAALQNRQPPRASWPPAASLPMILGPIGSADLSLRRISGLQPLRWRPHLRHRRLFCTLPSRFSGLAVAQVSRELSRPRVSLINQTVGKHL